MFALYSAWYFWIPKILGVEYNRSWGNIHFWILFLGVNVTFFPQHFLGLQGMPRRISDYADAFAGWNLVSSFGSLISLIATWFFLYILYVQLVHGKATSRYLWLTPQFYYDILQTLLSRGFNSLEWGLNSPPKPHAFVSLPLQSRFSIKGAVMVITLTGLVGSFVIVAILFLANVLIHVYVEMRLDEVVAHMGIHADHGGFKSDIKQILICHADRNPEDGIPSGSIGQGVSDNTALVPSSSGSASGNTGIVPFGSSTGNTGFVRDELGNLRYVPTGRPFSSSLDDPTRPGYRATERALAAWEAGGLNNSNVPQNPAAQEPASSTHTLPGTGVSNTTATPSNALVPQNPAVQGPVSSAHVLPGMGVYEIWGQGQVLRRYNYTDLQAIPEYNFRIYTSELYTNYTTPQIKHMFPSHIPGEGQGWGYLGANRVHLFQPLLGDRNIPHFRDHFSTIPPTKGEAMINPYSEFWCDLWKKHKGEGIGGTESNWPIWYKSTSPDTVLAPGYNNTLIGIKCSRDIFGAELADELKQNCVYVMRDLIDLLSNEKEWYDESDSESEDENYEKQYWRYLHEYMAARHFYQVYLLDDNTNP